MADYTIVIENNEYIFRTMNEIIIELKELFDKRIAEYEEISNQIGISVTEEVYACEKCIVTIERIRNLKIQGDLDNYVAKYPNIYSAENEKKLGNIMDSFIEVKTNVNSLYEDIQFLINKDKSFRSERVHSSVTKLQDVIRIIEQQIRELERLRNVCRSCMEIYGTFD